VEGDLVAEHQSYGSGYAMIEVYKKRRSYMGMFFIIFFSVFGGYIVYKQEKNMNLPNILKIFISVCGFTATGLASMEYITWNIAMIMIIANSIICLLLEFIYKKLEEQDNE
jgi:hypothetical protein